MSLRKFQIYFDKVKPSCKLYILTKVSFQTEETPEKNYFSKLLSICLLFAVSLPSSDTLVHFLGHTAIMNAFKFLNM